MRYYNKKAIAALALILTLGAASCDEYLNIEPLDEVTVDQVYNSGGDLTQAVAGVYSILSNDWMFRRGRLMFPLELRADAMMLGTTRRSGVRLEIATYTYTADNGFVQNYWEQHYRGINNANVLIEKAPEASDASAAIKSRTIAEAHFLRAFYYFSLVRLWGEVPLVTFSPATYEEALDLKPGTVEQIYVQIIEDAKYANGEVDPAIILPVQDDNQGRVGLTAAQTLLADVYLTLGNYSESARYAQQVINSGQHALWDDYADAFSIDLQYESNAAPGAESIFEVKFAPDVDPGSRFADYAWPRSLILPYSAASNRVGSGFFEVHESVYDALDTTDARVSYMFPKTYVLGSGAESVLNPAADTIAGGAYEGQLFNQEPPYFCIKYPTDNDRQRFGWSKNPWPIYRYADVLLMYAEAVNEQGVAGQDVLDQTVNLLRERANLAPLTGGGQDEVREAIKEERFVEFFFEGKRFHDLVRWGELSQEVNQRNFDYEVTTAITEADRFLPIPQRAIDTNPNIDE